MAIMRKSEFRQISETELLKRLDELNKEMIKINAQISTGTSPENPGRVKEVKKTIAKILTLLKRKELEKTLQEVRSRV